MQAFLLDSDITVINKLERGNFFFLETKNLICMFEAITSNTDLAYDYTTGKLAINLSNNCNRYTLITIKNLLQKNKKKKKKKNMHIH